MVFFLDETELLTEMSELIPAIDEANAISEDLDKKINFQLVFIPPQFQALGHERTKPKTKVGFIVSIVEIHRYVAHDAVVIICGRRINRFLDASSHLYERVCPSVRR